MGHIVGDRRRRSTYDDCQVKLTVAFIMVKIVSGLFLYLLADYSADGFPSSLRISAEIPLRASQQLVDECYHNNRPSTTLSRPSFFQSVWLIACASPALAFEGGVGGLGKTKPDIGVVFLSKPTSDNGLVNAELVLPNVDRPVRVSFQAPKTWPLMAGSGLEARDLQTGDSAFVLVVSTKHNGLPLSTEQVKELLLESLLSSKGKFGAYGSPTDIKVKAADQLNLYTVTFTTLTPNLHESDRKMYLQLHRPVSDSDKSLLMFVVGTNRQRFASQEAFLRHTVDSFLAVRGPVTKLMR
jgi:hypothetical protein